MSGELNTVLQCSKRIEKSIEKDTKYLISMISVDQMKDQKDWRKNLRKDEPITKHTAPKIVCMSIKMNFRDTCGQIKAKQSKLEFLNYNKKHEYNSHSQII